MTWHFGAKDGGPESRVRAYGYESKRLGSVLLLRFGDGTRDAFHSHAFNAVSWLLRGALHEHVRRRRSVVTNRWYLPSLRPIVTPRARFHQVESRGTSWVLSVRGPWVETWREKVPGQKEYLLTHGRKRVMNIG